jgi:hypothetical protein
MVQPTISNFENLIGDPKSTIHQISSFLPARKIIHFLKQVISGISGPIIWRKLLPFPASATDRKRRAKKEKAQQRHAADRSRRKLSSISSFSLFG